jgi:DNA transformation protein
VKKDLALADHVLDLLTPLGGVTRRYMFGGWGFYKDGLFFALIADWRFYLKTGPENVQEFIDAGLAPWIYEIDKGTMKMSYHEAPESVLENPAIMAVWVRKGLAAAKIAAAKKAGRKRKKR